ncbi:hypothetical protein H0V99_04100 [Candidatus Saccharibacteria bacterium]|nr:hypothetical protein [Candidatus Saccharibacteria bacterium]
MSEVSKAFVIGGFSEDHTFLEGFTNEICDGPHSLVDEAESITIAEGFKDIDKLNKEAARRIIFAHSAANMVIRKAGIIVALNGVEPTPLFKTIRGAVKVGTNSEIGRDEHIPKTGLTNGFKEVMRHPSTLKVPFMVRKFSTSQMLIDGGKEAFPGGRLYLPTDMDEFGFGSDETVTYATSHGISAKMLPGYHNQPLLHPREAVRQIYEILDEIV